VGLWREHGGVSEALSSVSSDASVDSPVHVAPVMASSHFDVDVRLDVFAQEVVTNDPAVNDIR